MSDCCLTVGNHSVGIVRVVVVGSSRRIHVTLIVGVVPIRRTQPPVTSLVYIAYDLM